VRGDDRHDVDHEADFIINLVHGWRIDDNHVSIGVVSYDKEVKEQIHLDDYSGDKGAVIDKLENLAKEVGDTGNVYIPTAMHWVNGHMYEKHQRGAQKVAVAIVHRMSSDARAHFAQEAQRMKADGVKLYGIGVNISPEDAAVLQANTDTYLQYPTFDAMENSVPSNFGLHC